MTDPTVSGILVSVMAHLRQRWYRTLTRLGILVSLSLVMAPSVRGADRYGYLSQVEGPVDLLHNTSRASVEATPNYPIQVGDQLRVSPGGRLEAVLPDGSLVRVGGNSELRFGKLTGAQDTHDDSNLLHLVQGLMQVEVQETPIAIDGFRIDCANATVYLLEAGSYRIFTDGASWTQLVVRTGAAEVVTRDDSQTVQAGQQALVDGDTSPAILLEAAAPPDGLEVWADRVASEAAESVKRGYVAPSLTYAAAPLWRHGTWVRIGRKQVWRPRVKAGWRPYHSGWWVYTPSGLTWISTEPWGWVTYHYGAWDYASGMGWVWHPGSVYTPGAVYWYWGPSYVGWMPASPYSPYYQDPYYALPPYGYSGGLYRFGNHPRSWTRDRWTGFRAHAGSGSPGLQRWTFCPYDRFGYRNSYRHLISEADLDSTSQVWTDLQSGILTTETRGLTPDLWETPDRLLARLRHPRPSPRSSRSELSPLSAAAIGSSTTPEGRPVRQWDPTAWRKNNLSRPSSTPPHRRYARFSRSVRSRESRGQRDTRTSRGRSGYRYPDIGRAGSRSSRFGLGGRTSSSGVRPAPPGRSNPVARRPGASRNGTSRPGASNRPGRVSGTSRPGKPNGGPG